MSGLMGGVNENIQVKNGQEKYDVKLSIREWKQYPEYKDSGVEWIGEIPKGWKYNKLSRCAFYQEGPGLRNWQFVEDGIKVICVTNITDKGINFEIYQKFISNEEYQKLYKHFCVKKGDLILSSSGNSWGKVAEYNSDETVILNTSTIRINENNSKKLCREFIKWILQSDSTKEQLRLMMTGSCQPNFGPTHLDKLVVPILPSQEQKLIATFLERETSKIDTLIEKKQRFIELLEEKRSALISHAVTKGLAPDVRMKYSGVEWIGEIPESWALSKLKHLTSKIGSGKTPRGGSEIYCGSGIIFLRSQNIHFDGLRLDDVVYIDESIDLEMSSTRVLPDDVLLNITGASIGRSSIVPKDFPQANVNQHVCIIRPLKKQIDSRFLHYELSSDCVQALIFSNENGTSREGLTFSRISNFMIAIPNNLDEQRLISDFLDRETEKIDTFINKISAQIEKLKEYRTALISAAVTGKIDVREEVA